VGGSRRARREGRRIFDVAGLERGGGRVIDPIFTPIFLSGLVAAGVTASAAAVVAPILSGIAVAALGLLITSLLAPRPPKPDDGKVPIQQSVPYRNYVIGQARVSGAVMLMEEFTNDLYVVLAQVSHEISEFVAFYLNDDQIDFTTTWDGTAAGGPKEVDKGAKGQYGDGYVLLWWRMGAESQPVISKFVTDLPSMWTTDCIGKGTAYLGALFYGMTDSQKFSKVYPFGRPQLSSVIRGARVWDFRDTDQDPEDPTTWTFSKNPVLAIAWFECFSEFGSQRDYTKALLPVIDTWKAEADICDEPITLKAGGTQSRYELGGWASTETDPKAVRIAMLAACDGWMCERGDGAIILIAGKYREPTVTLTDDDISGFYVEGDIPSEDACNALQVTFTSPDHGYSEVEADPWEDEDDQLARGKRLASLLSLQWVQDFRQGRRLGKREMYRRKRKLQGSLDLRLSGINACYERWIAVDTAIIPRLGGLAVIENRMTHMNLTGGGFNLEFVGSGPEIDDWDPDTDEGAAPPLPEVADDDPPAAPSDVAVVAESAGGVVYLEISFDDPSDSSLNYTGSWRFADDGTGGPGPWTGQAFDHKDTSAGRVTVRMTGIPANQELEVRVRAENSMASDWSDIVPIDTSDPAPGSPTSLSATGAAGHATIAFDCPNSAVMYAYRIYRNTSGGTFGGATLIAGPVGAVRNQHVSYRDDVAAGAYDYWATAENSSGVSSSPTGPQGATVT
jgi:hypothetical protein